MDHVETTAANATHVRALFSDRAASFDLAKDATLTDLIDRLDSVGGWGSGAPTAVFLQFGNPRVGLNRSH
jgi:hypothetical protein